MSDSSFRLALLLVVVATATVTLSNAERRQGQGSRYDNRRNTTRGVEDHTHDPASLDDSADKDSHTRGPQTLDHTEDQKPNRGSKRGSGHRHRRHLDRFRQGSQDNTEDQDNSDHKDYTGNPPTRDNPEDHTKDPLRRGDHEDFTKDPLNRRGDRKIAKPPRQNPEQNGRQRG